ncbi:hypothetical protein ACOMHN_044644 [Nucella lapillus]
MNDYSMFIDDTHMAVDSPSATDQTVPDLEQIDPELKMVDELSHVDRLVPNVRDAGSWEKGQTNVDVAKLAPALWWLRHEPRDQRNVHLRAEAARLKGQLARLESLVVKQVLQLRYGRWHDAWAVPED